MSRFIFTISFLLVNAFLFGQYMGFDQIDSSKIDKWIVNDNQFYQGVYHFGDSDKESLLILFFVNDTAYAQLQYGEWNYGEDAAEKPWISYFVNFSNLSIENNQFYTDQMSGDFVTYYYKDSLTFGIKTYNPYRSPWYEFPYNDTCFEVSNYITADINRYIGGDNPETFYKKLNEKDLEKMSPQELRILQNEIYARYSYVFEIDKEMDVYFKKQDWYFPLHEDVSSYINQVEIYNIAIINKILQNKKKNE